MFSIIITILMTSFSLFFSWHIIHEATTSVFRRRFSIICSIITSAILIFFVFLLWFFTTTKQIHSNIKPSLITATITQNKVASISYKKQILQCTTMQVDTLFTGVSSDSSQFEEIFNVNIFGEIINSKIRKKE